MTDERRLMAAGMPLEDAISNCCAMRREGTLPVAIRTGIGKQIPRKTVLAQVRSPYAVRVWQISPDKSLQGQSGIGLERTPGRTGAPEA